MASDSLSLGAARKDGAGGPVKLGDRFEIFPDQPLPAFDGVAGHAFAARAFRRKIECYALICNGSVPPRLEAPSTLLTLDHPGLIKLLDFGVVDWDPGRTRRQAMVFERPQGRRLMASISTPIEPLSEDQIVRMVVASIGPVLKELAGRAVTHGNIRPSNMFVRDAAGGGVTLCECASVPPGYGQLALFEPLERAMADHLARGGGTSQDDLYAFGVTLLILALGRNPVQGMDEDAMIAAKIERGSFAALVGSTRLPQNLTEPLRGMLLDDPKQRWNVGQLDLWMSGRRLSPKQSQMSKRAARPLEIAGQEAWHCRGLSRLIGRNVGAAIAQLENGDIDRWLRRGMSDEAMADVVAAAVESAGVGGVGKASSLADRVVARVGIALDPTSPIRYKGRAVMPEGLAVALADACLRRDGTQPLAEIIAWQLPMFWANAQTDFRAELVPMAQLFESQRVLLEKTGPGYGLERVLYELNPYLHCLSPIVADFYAVTPTDLLIALDGAASRRDRAREPLDRHIAAFLASRHRRVDDALFSQLPSNNDPVRRMAALLTILGDIQARAGLHPLPALCKWIGLLLEPSFVRFYSRPLREELRLRAEKASGEGKLLDLLKIIDDPESVRKDAQSFAHARREHKKATSEIDKLKAVIADPDGIAETSGRRVAATFSSAVGLMIAVVLSVFYLFR